MNDTDTSLSRIGDEGKLDHSIYRNLDGVRHKTCPRCSMAAGYLRFFPEPEWEDVFGYRTIKGQKVIQPNCKPCRGI